MNLPAPLARVGLLMRATLDLWAGGSTNSLQAWDAAKGGSRLKGWIPPSTDFAATLSPALLKSRARDAARNNPWACRAVNLLRDYVVGVGIKPQVGIPDAALRARVAAKWTKWTDESDHAGTLDFYGQQAQAFRAAAVDGEVLALIRPGRPLKIQILPSEFLDVTRDNGKGIGGGIQFDSEGRRLGYWLYSKNPAEMLTPISTFVPADRVVHLFAPTQPGFERGTSWLAPALVPLYELQSYLESSLVRARTGSLFCGFIRSADGSNVLVNEQGGTTFEPGSMARLRPGDEIEFSTPPDPTNGFAPFVTVQLRSIAASLGLPYELLSNDFSQVTYASGRGALLAFQRTTEALAHNLMAFQFCRPIFAWWLKIAVATGELPESVLAAPVRWIPQPMAMLDSRMEVQSTLQRVRAGFLSRSEAVSMTGLDPEALDAEIARDNARADALGLIYDSDARRMSLQGQEQPSAANDATIQ